MITGRTESTLLRATIAAGAATRRAGSTGGAVSHWKTILSTVEEYW